MRNGYLDPTIYADVVSDCYKLGVSKRHDYARKVDGLAITKLHGLTIRLVDKALRAYNVVGIDTVITTETLRDTLMDIVNYAVYGIVMCDGNWDRFTEGDYNAKCQASTETRQAQKAMEQLHSSLFANSSRASHNK